MNKFSGGKKDTISPYVFKTKLLKENLPDNEGKYVRRIRYELSLTIVNRNVFDEL